jgi:serine/threonine protein kinase
MAAAFQDASCVYIVLEFVQGGPFDARLRDHGRVAPKAAAFYAAQVVLVLEVLHSQHYVYRDLKPANLVFDLKGYLKVCDFGLTKSVATGLCTTLCGTPDYMAPEILRKERYGIAVDWWALGVLLCEMLTGKTPFVADDPLATYHNILQHTIGRSLSDIQTTPKACVRALLTVAPTQRLGVLPNVRKHKFFKKINWKALLRRDVAPPHDPYVSSDADTSNFDEFEDSRSESHPCDFQGADPFADFS